jgi:hypothetical protein
MVMSAAIEAIKAMISKMAGLQEKWGEVLTENKLLTAARGEHPGPPRKSSLMLS